MVPGRIASSVVRRQVKYVTPVPVPGADPVVSTVYGQVADESRIVVPPALVHSPCPDLLAAYWMLVRETLVASGNVDRLAKEAVAAAVSVATICPYCVDMHSTGMYDLSTEHDAEAIVLDRVGDVADPRVRAIAEWARLAHVPDNCPPPPFPEADRPELVGVVVAFHYLTRMVNLFLPSFLLSPRLGPRARRRFKQGVSRVLAPTLREVFPAGRSLDLLPDAALPAAAAWAAGRPTVAAAVARSYAAFAAAGDRSVPPEVRELVLDRVDAWRGEEAGLSRDWCEDLVDTLPVGRRDSGRLALLVAFASHQVDDDVVARFRAVQPGDRALLETAAWASFAAARAVGRWHIAPAAATVPTGPWQRTNEGAARTGPV